MGKYIHINKNSVTIKEPTVVVFDGKIFIVDEKKKVNIQSALNNGAYWRSTADGLLLLIQNGEVILVTRKKGGGGGHGGGYHGDGSSNGESSKNKLGGNIGRPRKGFKTEVEKAKFTSLRDFDKVSEKYARDLQDRIGWDDERTKAFVNKFKKIIDDSDYIFRRSALTVEKIANGGHYKNQIELFDCDGIIKTKGAWLPEDRKDQSDVMFHHGGIDKNRKPLNGDDFEKYGCLAPKDMTIPTDAEEYGDCIVRLKKDRMNGRTTYTYGDSLDNDYPAGDITKPSLAGFGDGYYNGILGAESKIDNAKNVNDLSRGNSYVELQFHGTVTADDIDSVTYTDKDDLSRNVFEKLKKRGIKVYIDKGKKRGSTERRNIQEIKKWSDMGEDDN